MPSDRSPGDTTTILEVPPPPMFSSERLGTHKIEAILLKTFGGMVWLLDSWTLYNSNSIAFDIAFLGACSLTLTR